MEATAFINGKAYTFHEGETLLSFVKRHLGAEEVPTLCDASNLEPFGSCRLCCVEVALEENGPGRVVAACHTPVTAGSYLSTRSEKIRRLRKNIVELILTDHPLDCLTCEANGDCELQTVAAMVGIRDVRYPNGENHLHVEKDTSHPYMRSDLSKCINCYRCVRACDEIQGQFVLSMAGRGFDNRIIKSLDTSFDDSDCVACGACAQTCPTAAISDIFKPFKTTANAETRTVCTYCGVGCNLNVLTNGDQLVCIEAPYDAEVNQGHTCLKGRYAFRFYDHPERLRTPLIRKNGELKETSWDEAYQHIADKLTDIKNTHGPDSIAGISSARCTNEENYLMQKFIRAVIGTNNIDGCARVCHSPTALGMQRTFGTGAATNSIEDLNHTQCVLVIGANPTKAHPVTGAKIKQHAIRGKELIVIDPYKTELGKYATHYLPVRPGANVALLNIMLHYIVKEGLVDTEFVNSRTEGYADLSEALLGLNINELENVCGVSKELIRDAAVAYANATEAMSFHGLGVTEHFQGTFAVMKIAELAMLTGNIGRKGVGVNPLRGQNNVQGAADMGVQPHQGAGYLDVTNPEIHSRYEEFYGAKLSSQIGYKIPEMFSAAIDGKLKACWIVGEDVVQTDPNTTRTLEALKCLDLLVVQELFLTETARLADVVLPGASFLEKSGTFTNGERRVQRVNKVLEPIGNSKADGQIIVDIMNKLGYQQPDYDPAVVLEEISQIVPFFKGIRWDELGINGKQWPVADNGQDTKILHTETFKIGAGRLKHIDFAETSEVLDHAEQFPYILTTVRELEHYNCGAMSRRTANLDILPEDLLIINPLDADAKNIEDGDLVRIWSNRGEITIKAKVSSDVKAGVLSTTFHFPDVMVNSLTSNVYDSEAMCPEYKVVSVDFAKV